MKSLLRPRVILPIILSVSLLVALFAVADVRAVARQIEQFRPVYLLAFFGVMAAYEIVRCLQWQLMLGTLEIRVPGRTGAFTFLVGEMAKSLPFGQYLRNYLLRQSGGANLGKSAPATLVALLIEDGVSLVGVMVLGLGNWPWLRPSLAISMVALVVIAVLAYVLVTTGHMPRWVSEQPQLHALRAELRLFRQGTRMLARPKSLLVQAALGAIYLVLGAAGLYTLVLGLGGGPLPFTPVLAVYFFSLAAGLLIPLPVDFGLIEVSGVAACLAIGLGRDTAVAAMLLNRVLGGVAGVLFGLVALVIFQRELRDALRGRVAAGRPRPSVAATATPKPVAEPEIDLGPLTGPMPVPSQAHG